MFDEPMVVERVTQYREGDAEIRFAGGLCFCLGKEHKGKIKAGDTVRTYSTQGSLIRGMDVNGERLFYKTDEQLEAEHQEQVAESEREHLRHFKKKEPEIKRQISALSPRLKARMERFLKETPDFLKKGDGQYELFILVEADKIAMHLRPKLEQDYSEKNVRRACVAFRDCPDYTVASKEHSGNTFGCALQLAFRVLLDLEC